LEWVVLLNGTHIRIMYDIAFLGFIHIRFYIFHTWTRSILASNFQNCSIPHGHPSDHFRLGVGLGASARWGLCSHGLNTSIVFWITFRKWFFFLLILLHREGVAYPLFSWRFYSSGIWCRVSC